MSGFEASLQETEKQQALEKILASFPAVSQKPLNVLKEASSERDPIAEFERQVSRWLQQRQDVLHAPRKVAILTNGQPSTVDDFEALRFGSDVLDQEFSEMLEQMFEEPEEKKSPTVFQTALSFAQSTQGETLEIPLNTSNLEARFDALRPKKFEKEHRTKKRDSKTTLCYRIPNLNEQQEAELVDLWLEELAQNDETFVFFEDEQLEMNRAAPRSQPPDAENHSVRKNLGLGRVPNL